MARSLTTFQGPEIYVDAVMIVGLIDPTSPWHQASRELFQRAVSSVDPLQLVTAALAIDEAVFVLLEGLVSQAPYGVTRSRGRYLGSHPDTVRALMPLVDHGIDRVLRILSLAPVLPEDITAMCTEMLTTGTLPRDAIHLAVMRRMGIKAIASDDDGFDRYPDITLYKP